MASYTDSNKLYKIHGYRVFQLAPFILTYTKNFADATTNNPLFVTQGIMTLTHIPASYKTHVHRYAMEQAGIHLHSPP